MSSTQVHSTAIIHPTAKLGNGVSVGPYAVIGEDCEIGDAASIGAHSILEYAVIGSGCKISPHAFVGTPPQDFKYGDEKTRLILGSNCIVRECVTLNRGTVSDGGKGITKIGSNCFFMAYSHVGHDCEVGTGVVLTNSVALGGHVTVGDFAVLGGLVGVHQFVRIGTLAMIGGVSGVDRDVAPYCMAQGDRVTLIGLNSVGLRRQGFTRQVISDIRNAYKILFLSHTTLEKGIEKLRSQGALSEPIKELIHFLASPSKRGIARPRMLENLPVEDKEGANASSLSA